MVKIKIKINRVILIASIFVFILNFSVYAFDKPSVDIKIETDKHVYNRNFKTKIKINYNDIELNENIYLSYHIYNENNELIIFECPRIPIVVKNSKIEVSTVPIDLTMYPQLDNLNEISIKFDIIDEKNAYWFSTNDKIKFTTENLIFTDDFFINIKLTLINAIKNSPFIFSVNFLICIFFVICINKMKKIFS